MGLNEILTEIETVNLNGWAELLEKKENTVDLDYDSFIEDNLVHINHYLLGEKAPILAIYGTLFGINDTGYGEVCKKCGSPAVLVKINKLEPANADTTIWIPSIESFVRGGVITGVPKIRIPIDVTKIDNYSWSCACCSPTDWNKFIYKKGFGLLYDEL